MKGFSPTFQEEDQGFASMNFKDTDEWTEMSETDTVHTRSKQSERTSLIRWKTLITAYKNRFLRNVIKMWRIPPHERTLEADYKNDVNAR